MQIDVIQQINSATPKQDYASVVLQALARSLEEVHFQHRATACLTDLATALHCARISFGIFHDQSIHIEAISHTTKMDTGSELQSDLSDAMEEAIDQKTSIRVPKTLTTHQKLLLVRANEQLKSRMGGMVQTVPFSIQNEYVGAVSFEWDSLHQPLAPDEHELTQIVNLIGPILFLAYQEDRSIVIKIQDALRKWTHDLFGNSTRWRQLAIIGVILTIITGLALKPVQRNITANAKIEGRTERIIAAPMDGYIDEVLIRPGDRVFEGQTIIELSAHELLIEAQRIETELSQHENAYIAAFARADRSEMMSSLSQAEEARASLELIQQQRSRLTLTAPMEGIVIDGDIGQLQGAPIVRGEVLITLAPLEGYRVILEVDERDIGKISLGQSGQLLLSALPHTPIEIHIDRITPMTQMVDGNNVYRVEALLAENLARLRPGLHGVAKLSASPQPLFTSLWQWLDQRIRVLWWRWGG